MSIAQQEADLREQLIHVIHGDQSHIEFDDVIKDFPSKLAGQKPKGAPHTAWQLLEHLRIAQSDILEFCRNPKYKSPKWPEGYWPSTDAPPDEQAWEASIAAYRKDAAEIADLIKDTKQDLYKAVEGGKGQTLLQEAVTLGNHNSYHLGQLMFLKKMLIE